MSPAPDEGPPSWFPVLGTAFAACSGAAILAALVGWPWWYPASAALLFLAAILMGAVLEAQRRNRGHR